MRSAPVIRPRRAGSRPARPEHRLCGAWNGSRDSCQISPHRRLHDQPEATVSSRVPQLRVQHPALQDPNSALDYESVISTTVALLVGSVVIETCAWRVSFL